MNLLGEIFLWTIAAIPTTIGIVLRRWVYRVCFKKMGKRVTIDADVTIQGFRRIELGDRVSIMKRSALYATEGTLSIGDGVSINTNVQISASQGRITIGKDGLIGPNCVLRAAHHRYDDPDRPIQAQGHSGGEIVLEDDVWLASNVVVVKDVRIGKESIIGAQSVVTKSIPPYSIAHGNSATVVRSRHPNLRAVAHAAPPKDHACP